MALLPLAEIVWRSAFRSGIPGSGPFVQHLTLWVGFLGAGIAAREGRLLALATGTLLPEGLWRRAGEVAAAAIAATISTLLCRAGIGLVLVGAPRRWSPGPAASRAPRAARWRHSASSPAP